MTFRQIAIPQTQSLYQHTFPDGLSLTFSNVFKVKSLMFATRLILLGYITNNGDS